MADSEERQWERGGREKGKRWGEKGKKTWGRRGREMERGKGVGGGGRHGERRGEMGESWR